MKVELTEKYKEVSVRQIVSGSKKTISLTVQNKSKKIILHR